MSGCVVEPLSLQDERGRFTVEIEPNARASVSFRIAPRRTQTFDSIRIGRRVPGAGTNPAKLRQPWRIRLHRLSRPARYFWLAIGTIACAYKEAAWQLRVAAQRVLNKLP